MLIDGKLAKNVIRCELPFDVIVHVCYEISWRKNNISCFIAHPIPRKLSSPIFTFPPVATPGPVLEKL